jgi:hypothetical protein
MASLTADVLLVRSNFDDARQLFQRPASKRGHLVSRITTSSTPAVKDLVQVSGFRR